MSATASPFGLRPAYHPSGYVRNVAGTITTGYNANIFQHSPIQIIADGSIALAAAGARACGVFLGVEWTDSDGRRRVSNKWTASTAGTSIVAYYTTDAVIVYEIQSSASLVQDDTGGQFDWSTNNTSSGNTTTGLSNVSLNAASGAANAGLQVLGLAPDMDNAWGDTYVNVYVRISEHQFVADVAAF